MSETGSNGLETVGNPSLDVLGWIQKKVFTHPAAYYHEGYNEKIIDQMWGAEGTWLWVGLNNEGGRKYKIKDAGGLELEVREMAHVTIERSDREYHEIDTRWLKILLVDGAVRVHMHHFGKDYTEGTEVSEHRFLSNLEAEGVYHELQEMAA